MEQIPIQPQFIKPFSRGQITLPKRYRDYLGINENSWLKISLEDNKIFLQKIQEAQESRIIKSTVSRNDYLKKILEIRGKWFSEDEYKKTRKGIEKRLLRNEKNFR